MPNALSGLQPGIRQLLVTALSTKRTFFWIGSGFSANFGYPSWTAVLEKVRQDLGYLYKLDFSNPLRAAEILCSFAAEKGLSEEQFNNHVIMSLKSLHDSTVKDPGWTALFVKIAPDILVTTNWDDVLERIF